MKTDSYQGDWVSENYLSFHPRTGEEMVLWQLAFAFVLHLTAASISEAAFAGVKGQLLGNSTDTPAVNGVLS